MPRTATVKSTVVPDVGPTVVAAIAGWPDERLRALLRRRADLVTPPPRSLGGLAERAVSPQSVSAAYRRLDRAAQQVLEVVALFPPPVTAEQAAALLAPGVEPAHLERPLALLEESALLLRSGGGWSVNPGLNGSVRRNGLGPPAASLLAGHSAGELAAMCKRLGAAPGRNKGACMDAVVASISQPETVRRLLRKAPEGVAELAGRAASGAVVPVGGAWSLTDKTPAGWLYRRGLLAPLDWYRLTMPGEVALAIRGGTLFESFSADPPELALTPADPAKVGGAGAERALAAVEHIVAMLDSLAAQPAKLLKDGGIGVRELRRLAKATDRSERDTARLLDMAVAAGLLWIDSTLDAALPTAAFDDWIALGAPAQWGAIVAGWRDADFHPSLAGAIGANDKPIPPVLPRGHESVARDRRHAVLAAMAEVGPGFAADTDALSERSRWTSPDLWGGGPATPSTLCRWVLEECELLGLAVGGTLSESGRLVASGDVPAATESLAALLPTTTSEIVLQADLTAIAAGPLAPEVAAELDVLADVESKGAATVYRFGEQSLRRALDAGRTAEGIAAFLAHHAPRGVPQSLSYLVGDVGRRHGVARVGTASCYVRSDDAGLLAEMVRARATRGLALRQLAPTVAVSDQDPTSVLTALRRAGYLPAEEDAKGGLVVTRKSLRRAPSRRVSPSADGAGRASQPCSPDADADSLLAALRRAAPPRPPVAKRAAAPVERLRAVPSPSLFEDEPARPSAIVRDPANVIDLFNEAFVEDEALRVSYTNGKGVTSQVNVIVVDVDDDEVVVHAFPRMDRRVLRLDRVHWARVLTEAEEEAL